MEPCVNAGFFKKKEFGLTERAESTSRRCGGMALSFPPVDLREPPGGSLLDEDER
jgi:hypothetical protein